MRRAASRCRLLSFMFVCSAPRITAGLEFLPNPLRSQRAAAPVSIAPPTDPATRASLARRIRFRQLAGCEASRRARGQVDAASVFMRTRAAGVTRARRDRRSLATPRTAGGPQSQPRGEVADSMSAATAPVPGEAALCRLAPHGESTPARPSPDRQRRVRRRIRWLHRGSVA